MTTESTVILTGNDLSYKEIVAIGIGVVSNAKHVISLVTFRKLLFSSQLFDDISIYNGEK